jgi:predicted nucleic acid-binding protein
VTLYDSSVLIDYLSNDADAVAYIERHIDERAVAPPLVLFEVYQGEVFKSGPAALDSEFKCLRCCAGDFSSFLGTDVPTTNCDCGRTSIHSVVTAQRISNTYSRTYLCTYPGT